MEKIDYTKCGRSEVPVSEKWWVFQINDEQIKGIKNGELDAISDFFIDNLLLIKNIARKVKYSPWTRFVNRDLLNMYNLEDMVNQVFCDLQYFRYENSHTLYNDILRSCSFVAVGGILGNEIYNIYTKSLDAPISAHNAKDEGNTFCLGDIIGTSIDFDKVINQSEHDKKFDKMLFAMARKLYPNCEDKMFAFVNSF